jgi:hypothetical protein
MFPAELKFNPALNLAESGRFPMRHEPQESIWLPLL